MALWESVILSSEGEWWAKNKYCDSSEHDDDDDTGDVFSGTIISFTLASENIAAIISKELTLFPNFLYIYFCICI